MPESQPSPSMPVSQTEICPHLGIEEDIQTCLAYPSHWNLCYRSEPASVVRLSHQRKKCLLSAHTSCPFFKREQAVHLPLELRGHRRANKLASEGSRIPSILFVCTANRFRSPLAAAMLRKNLEEMGIAASWRIGSAGTWAEPGQPVVPGIYETSQKFGIDLSSHRSTRVSQKLLSNYDLILVMQTGQKEALLSEFPDLQERVYLLSNVAERRSYDIPDALDSEGEMLEVMTELDSLIRRGLESICVLATYLNNTRRKSDS